MRRLRRLRRHVPHRSDQPSQLTTVDIAATAVRTTCGYCGVGCALDVHTRVRRGHSGHSGSRRTGQPGSRLRQGPLRVRLRALDRPAHHPTRTCRRPARAGLLGPGPRHRQRRSAAGSSAPGGRTRSLPSPRPGPPTKRTTSLRSSCARSSERTTSTIAPGIVTHPPRPD